MIFELSENESTVLEAYFEGKHVIFIRKGLSVRLDCSAIPDSERFMLVLEWNDQCAGAWASWIDSQDGIHEFYNRAWFNPSQGRPVVVLLQRLISALGGFAKRLIPKR